MPAARCRDRGLERRPVAAPCSAGDAHPPTQGASMRRRSAVLLTAALSAVASTASAQTFDFETTPLFTAVPFSITTGGLTATFSSEANFGVQPSPFSTLTGNVLFDD